MHDAAARWHNQKVVKRLAAPNNNHTNNSSPTGHVSRRMIERRADEGMCVVILLC